MLETKNKVYLKITLYNIAIITLIVVAHILLQLYYKKEIVDPILYNALALIVIGKFINYGLLIIFIVTFVVDYLKAREIRNFWKIFIINLILSVMLYLTLLLLTFKLV